MIRLNPKDANAYVNRGNAWYAKGEPDKAIADFTEAISLDAKHAMAFNNRGISWAAKEEVDKAIADYNEAIRIAPRDLKGYVNRGNIWSRLNKLDKSIADYDKAIQLKSLKQYFSFLWCRHRSVRHQTLRPLETQTESALLLLRLCESLEPGADNVFAPTSRGRFHFRDTDRAEEVFAEREVGFQEADLTLFECYSSARAIE